jgi:hypothetical protein
MHVKFRTAAVPAFSVSACDDAGGADSSVKIGGDTSAVTLIQSEGAEVLTLSNLDIPATFTNEFINER